MREQRRRLVSNALELVSDKVTRSRPLVGAVLAWLAAANPEPLRQRRRWALIRHGRLNADVLRAAPAACVMAPVAELGSSDA
jgi:hypothetical protein